MKIQLRYLFIFISFIIGSCAGDKYYLTIEDIDNTASDDSNSNPTKYYTLSFNASVLSSSSNKYSEESKTPYNSDTVLFSTGRVIHFFVYKGVNSSPYSNQYYFMGIYYAYENGFIKPQYSQYEILLPVGIYSIYAISEYNNPSDKTPPFSNSNGLGGEMVDLVNTLNYLWWKTKIGRASCRERVLRLV